MAFVGICSRFRYVNYFKQLNPSEYNVVTTLLGNRSNLCRQIDKNVSTCTSNMDSEREAFRNVFPEVITAIQNDPKFADVPEASNWMTKILEYNVTGGKNTRGLTTVLTYKMLEDRNKITEESLNVARKLGWCVEMAYCVIVDDIMDKAVTRRGLPCWYCRPDVGEACAMNDSIMVNSALFQILRSNCANLPNYIDMVHLMNETIFHTALGQHLDYKAGQMKRDYTKFTMDRYLTIVKHKTAHYTVYLPVTLGLLLVGNVNQEVFKHIFPICLEIGKLFQTQDDFIDCFGNKEIVGKAGTDIQEGKCSWLAVKALTLCSDAQRIVFKSCYGSNEPAHIERIRRLYEKLQLPKLYKNQEHAMYENIVELIQAIPCARTKQLFHIILDTHYKREK